MAKKATTAVVVHNDEEGDDRALTFGGAPELAGFKVGSVLTIPREKARDGVIYILKILEAMKIGKTKVREKRRVKDKEGNEVEVDDDQKPMMIVKAERFFSPDEVKGQTIEFILNAVVESSLKENYPNDGYVGKLFAISVGARVENQRYRKVEMVELER